MTKGRVLAVNTGSTSTKIAYFVDGKKLFEQNLAHSVETLSKFDSVMEQDIMRKDAITEFLSERNIQLEDIDIIMARGGLITPIKTGVYAVTPVMRKALVEAREGLHACNLSALIADDLAVEVNKARQKTGVGGVCKAYIPDPPMADEMLPEAKVYGLPEFSKRPLFHALNSRAMCRRYARGAGARYQDLTIIVAHMGGGTSVTLHKGGNVIDTNDALGGDGPISAERTGSLPGFPLVEMCFSGKYTKEEIKKRLVGKGGAVAWFGTNDFREIAAKADADPEGREALFLNGYCLGIAKYIASLTVDVCGKVDAIILTGGIAYSEKITAAITARVDFLAPVVVYPGENELESLAENGYSILSGESEIKTYDPNMSL